MTKGRWAGLALLGLLAGCGGGGDSDTPRVEASDFTDLVLTLLQAPDCAALGERIGDRILCQITNAGNKSFVTDFNAAVYLASSAPGGPPLEFVIPNSTITFPMISAGQTISFDFDQATIAGNFPLGSHTLTIQADFSGQVSESRSDNNFATFELTVYDPAVRSDCSSPVPVIRGLPVAPRPIVGPGAGN